MRAEVTKLLDMRLLEKGWDSYDAKPISPSAINKAIQMLDILPGDWIPVPCCDGAVQLERHEGGFDIEINIQVSP